MTPRSYPTWWPFGRRIVCRRRPGKKTPNRTRPCRRRRSPVRVCRGRWTWQDFREDRTERTRERFLGGRRPHTEQQSGRFRVRRDSAVLARVATLFLARRRRRGRNGGGRSDGVSPKKERRSKTKNKYFHTAFLVFLSMLFFYDDVNERPCDGI